MLTAVEFDDEPRFETGKVADVRADGPLSTEAEVAEPVQSEMTPEKAFGVGGILAQVADEFVHGRKQSYMLWR